MKQERISLFLAIFSGIVIGALSAQSIAEHFAIGKYLWFLGAALGGTVAWIGIDIRRFVSGAKLAVQHAWRQIVEWRPKVDWERIENYWKAYCLWLLSFNILLGYGILAVFCISDLEFVYPPNLIQWALALNVIHGMGIVAALFNLLFLIIAIQAAFDQDKAVAFFHFINPVTVIWAMVIVLRWSFGTVLPWMFTIALPSLVRGTIWLLVRTPRATMVTFRFLRRAAKLTFLYTNSERRTAGFVFAAIGASVGYFIGYVPIVALVGAAFGVLEFELTKSLRARMQEDRVTT